MDDTVDVRTARARDALAILLLSGWVIASRLPYINDFAVMGKDGPLYLRSMALGRDYDVPMPGNIGYVVLGKLAQVFLSNPVHAFEAVNIGLTCVGVGFFYLFATLVIPRLLALATAFALACNPMVWWHGGVIASYPVWLAVLPAIVWFGARFVRERRPGDGLGATVALGIGTTLRPDLIAFGAPLWFGCMVLGRARWRDWLIAVAILSACCAVWFFGTAWVLGGVDVYLEKVRAKHDWDKQEYSLASRGLVEGLLRNGTKYGLFLAWSSALMTIPFAREMAARLRRPLEHWRGTLLALLWVGPSWYFSFFVFAGNAGLIFPFLPLLYLGAAKGIGSGPKAVAVMVGLGLVSALQFVATPLLRETDQRRVILNVTFFRYSGAGLRSRYNYNLDDYGISPALASVVRQMRAPEPVPSFPPPN
jgi:MFS family permease